MYLLFSKCMDSQGSTNLKFACTDFRARKMVLHAHSCTQKLRVHETVMFGTNLHCLMFNLLIAIVFSLHILLSVNSKKHLSRICSTQKV